MTYNFFIIDTSKSVDQWVNLGILDNFYSLMWSQSFRDEGTFSLITTNSKQNVEMLKDNNLIYYVYRNSAMIIQYVKIDDNKNQMEVHGYDISRFLNYRCIPFSTFIHNFSNDIENLWLQNLRGSPLNEVATSNLPYVIDSTIQGNFSDIVKNWCEIFDIGYKAYVNFESNKLKWELYQGKDLTYKTGKLDSYIFSRENGNLINIKLLNDSSNLKNVAYVMGTGEGQERTVEIVGDTDIYDSSRVELWIDARDIQPDENEGETANSESYRQKLRIRGLEKLSEAMIINNIEAEVTGRDFGIKYNLGDKISAKDSKYNVLLNTRILKYVEYIDEKGQNIKLTFGQPEFNILRGGI